MNSSSKVDFVCDVANLLYATFTVQKNPFTSTMYRGRCNSHSSWCWFFLSPFGNAQPRQNAHVLPPAILKHGTAAEATCAEGRQKCIECSQTCTGNLTVPPCFKSAARQIGNRARRYGYGWFWQQVPNAIERNTAPNTGEMVDSLRFLAWDRSSPTPSCGNGRDSLTTRS